ncbi:MAG: VPLPA-CTERM sorting domain-containing protein [Gammaproteobacteria bacterium]|nr:VPLPA-CTERM sorting domain-containing protein [Gammaproteobacteria bacterium]
MKSLTMRLLAAIAVFALWSPIANAGSTGSVHIDLSQTPSFGLQGDPGNFSIHLDLGGPAVIKEIQWDVRLTPVAPSWLEEAQISFSNSNGDTEVLNLFPGQQVSDPAVSLGSQLSNLVLKPDGLLWIEFYEINFDDIAGGPDAFWDGALWIEYNLVPIPAAVWLFGSGLVGLFGMRRRVAA